MGSLREEAKGNEVALLGFLRGQASGEATVMQVIRGGAFTSGQTVRNVAMRLEKAGLATLRFEQRWVSRTLARKVHVIRLTPAGAQAQSAAPTA